MDYVPTYSPHQSSTPSTAHQQQRPRQTRISALQHGLLSYGSDIMARVTRSSKHKATPAPTPTKPAKADADTPLASVEAAPRNGDRKGPYQRKPRNKRQRDAIYKRKKRRQTPGGTGTERETARGRLPGNNKKTSKLLPEAISAQRAEIERLRSQLHGERLKSSETSAAASPNNSARAGPQQRQSNTLA